MNKTEIILMGVGFVGLPIGIVGVIQQSTVYVAIGIALILPMILSMTKG